MKPALQASLPGHRHRLPCAVYGPPSTRLALIVSADLSLWGDVTTRLVAAGYRTVAVELVGGVPELLLDDLSRAVRFLPSHDWVAGDGVVGAALVTVCGEQRVQVGRLVAIGARSAFEDPLLAARLSDSQKLLRVEPEWCSSVAAALDRIESAPHNQ